VQEWSAIIGFFFFLGAMRCAIFKGMLYILLSTSFVQSIFELVFFVPCRDFNM